MFFLNRNNIISCRKKQQSNNQVKKISKRYLAGEFAHRLANGKEVLLKSECTEIDQ